MAEAETVAVHTYICTVCKKTFYSGEWYGCRNNPTLAHKVEPRTYYTTELGLVLNAVPDGIILDNNNAKIRIPGKIVHFVAGQYRTDDPQLQEILNKRTPMSRQEWEEQMATTDTKIARLKKQVHEQASALEAARAEAERLKQELDELKAKRRQV